MKTRIDYKVLAEVLTDLVFLDELKHMKILVAFVSCKAAVNMERALDKSVKKKKSEKQILPHDACQVHVGLAKGALDSAATYLFVVLLSFGLMYGLNSDVTYTNLGHVLGSCATS